MAINVLLIGGGGREHALAWAIAKSSHLDQLYAAPGNAGIEQVARCVGVDVKDHDAVIEFCRTMAIGLVVIGPEAPLVAGLADALGKAGVKVFGPTAEAARLEGSKGFTKDLAHAAGIPTGEYAWLDTAEDAKAYLHGLEDGPLVVKADGLAAGKGVFMCETLAEADTAIGEIFSGRVGGGAGVLIEEWLIGEEVSFFALCDGETVLPLASAQDHKRAADGDTGPNTGGMGAYSPAPVLTPALQTQVMDRIILPTARAMAARGTPFAGVLFAGLMLTDEGPMLLEYNVRFGDPETQALMMRLNSDMLELLLATAEGRLAGHAAEWRDEAALTVVMAASGYPGTYEKGSHIGNLDEAGKLPSTEIFHAGTARSGTDIVANGGRVLGVTALGETLGEARTRAYAATAAIEWKEGFYRRDIGWREIARQAGGTSKS